MSIRIAAWNLEGRLGLVARRGRGSADRIVDALLKLDADVMFLPEAYGVRTANGVNERLEGAGYVWHDAQYRDAGKPTQPSDSNPHSRFLSRLPVVQHAEARYADIRTMQTIIVCDPDSGKEVRLMGVHLDDRMESLRIAQVEDIADYVMLDTRPTVLLGDFNAMHRVGSAKYIGSRFMKAIANMAVIPKVRSLLARLTDMATGTALQRLLATARLTDADPHRQPTMTIKTRGFTWLPSIRIAQLDHILTTSRVAVAEFQVAKYGGSDHRAISARIEVT